MSDELVPIERKFRNQVPKAHRHSLDTRLAWLWNQRSGTVQMVRKESDDVLDQTAATMILQALFAQDLASILLLFRRLEGGAIPDDQLDEGGELNI